MIKNLLPAATIFCLLMSCSNSRKAAVYFENIGDTTINRVIENLEPIIQKNDLLSITVSSMNEDATKIFNTPNATSAQVAGYLVNLDGNIEFPLIGNIKAAGLSKGQFKENLVKAITDGKYLNDPVVAVRYLNFKVTVLGEVLHPTVISVPNERINVLEALGLAGDMTVYAKRDNVMIIREEGGKRIVKRVNLNSHEMLYSPYYNLKSNDIVYVEPNQAKITGTSSSIKVWLPIILSTISLIAVIIYRAK